jgi:uncharacterized protein YtpQ (UPF0354 family)
MELVSPRITKTISGGSVSFLDKLFSKKPQREEFAKIAMAALRQRGLNDLNFEPSNYSIRLGSADKTFFLDNAYADYCAASKEERASCLQRYISAFVDSSAQPRNYDSAKSQLMPVVRDPAYYSLTRLMLKAQGSDTKKIEYPTTAIAEGLLAGAAVDTEHTITNVTQSDLYRWNVSFSQSLEQAVNNLRDRTDPGALKQIAPGIFFGEWGDSYDSARVLLPDLFHRIQLDGDPVVFVPNRNLLLAAGRYNAPALAIILKHGGESHFNQGHSLSPNLYVHQNDQWQLYVPEDESLQKQWLNIRRRRDATDYEQQKGYLEAIYSKEGKDIFLAGCQLIERNDESLFTRCVWSNEVDSSLPRVDSIAFGVDVAKKDILLVAWEPALQVVGHLMEPDLTLNPIRYRARVFPNSSQIVQLRDLAE